MNFLLLTLLIFSGTSLAVETYPLDILEEGASLAPVAEVFADYDKTKTIENFLSTTPPQLEPWQKPTGINFGLKDMTVWARVTLHNPLPSSKDIYIESAYSNNDLLTVYYVEDGKVKESYQAGDRFPYVKRQVDHRNPTFFFELGQGYHTFYFRLQTSGVNRLPLKIWSPQGFTVNKAIEYGLLGTIVGSLFVMFFFNFFVYTMTRSRSYLFYTLYIGSYLIYFCGVQGLTQEFITPESSVNFWSDKGTVLMINTSGVFGCLFSIFLLDTKKIFPWGHRVIVLVIAAYCINYINIFVDYRLGTRGVFIIMLAMSTLVPIIGASLALRGSRFAIYFALGWSALLGGTILLILMHLGVTHYKIMSNRRNN